MKKSVLSFVTATLLSTSAFADQYTDPLLASFERVMVREPSAPTIQLALAEADELAQIFAAAFGGQCGVKHHTIASARPAANRVGG
jgi:hypothetical protein